MAYRDMLTFDRDGRRFCYRVVAAIIHDGRVLLQTVPSDDFWFLPGGRAEFFEPANECLRREMKEELGEEVEVTRLLWVVENFFEHQGLAWHEVGLYWEARLAEESRLLREPGPFEGIEIESGAEFLSAWHDLTTVESLYLVPSFLKAALRRLPPAPEYVVHRNGDDAA